MGSFEEAEKKRFAENSAAIRREAELKQVTDTAARDFAGDLISWLGTKHRSDVQVSIEGAKVVLVHGRQQMSVTFKTDTLCTVAGVDTSPLETDHDGARAKVMEWVDNPTYKP